MKCAKSERTLHEPYTNVHNYTQKDCRGERGVQEGEECDVESLELGESYACGVEEVTCVSRRPLGVTPDGSQ